MYNKFNETFLKHINYKSKTSVFFRRLYICKTIWKKPKSCNKRSCFLEIVTMIKTTTNRVFKLIYLADICLLDDNTFDLEI